MEVEVVLWIWIRIWSDPELFWAVRIRFQNNFFRIKVQRIVKWDHFGLLGGTSEFEPPLGPPIRQLHST
jgi:hypothetical protein